MSISNLKFSLSPISVGVTTNRNEGRTNAESVESQGGEFSIENLSIEASLTEIIELCGNNSITTTSAVPKAEAEKAEEARAKADQVLNRAAEVSDICRAIMHKIDDLKKSSTLAPKASTPIEVKAPEAPETNHNDDAVRRLMETARKKKAAKPSEVTDDDEYI